MLAKLSYSVTKMFFYEPLRSSHPLGIIDPIHFEKNPFARFLAVEIVLPA